MARVNSFLSARWLKVPVLLLCLGPIGIVVWRAIHNDLTANPVEFITHATGDWTLRFIVITLAITPFRKLFHMPALIRYRRMLGLFAFFYGLLHFTTYIWLDQFFDVSSMIKDVAKRPFITAGFTGFVLMIPLAVTSTVGWIRRLGGRRWQLLHRAIYITAIAGAIHYYWLVKSDVRKPLLYAGIVALLLFWRLGVWLNGRGRTRVTGAVRSGEPTTAESV